MKITDKKNEFVDSVIKIAVPVTLQSLIQASFSVIDQVMTGQLGSVSVAGIGLAGKFSGLYSVIIAAVTAAGSILFAQYIGKKDREGISRTFMLTMLANTIMGIFFSVLCLGIPGKVMGLYSQDSDTVGAAAAYLFLIALGFLPMAWSNILAALFRCKGHAGFPLYASMLSAAVNTVLNYFLIFGHGGFPEMGIRGAAIATFIGRIVEFGMLLLFYIKESRRGEGVSLRGFEGTEANRKIVMTFMVILGPILINEFLWGLGENIYAIIYGHIGTDACAAMTLTNPVQSLMIGALTGISAATGIIIGKKLGEGDREAAYSDSKKMMLYGLIGSVTLSAILLATRGAYVTIFEVDETTRELTRQLLLVYAIIAPVKVENMIVAGGVLRSGGKTKIVLMIDLIGTWGVGVPLGLLTAFLLKFPITYVYLILSMEECVRLVIGLCIFRSKKWMNEIS